MTGEGDEIQAGGARPAAARERIELLDALRGFALFGILLVNIIGLSFWMELDEPARVALAGEAWEAGSRFAWIMLLEGKFYTLFSFLFGLGFALQLARLEGRGANGIAIFRRRLLILLAIGVTHLVLIWDGDILTLYALLGLTLPLFRGWSEKRLLTAAALLIALPIPGYALVAAAGIDPKLGLDDFGNRIWAQFGGVPGTEMAWVRRDDWGSYLGWVLSGWPFRIGNLIETWRIPKVLAIMLIGLIAGRRLAAGTLLENRRLLKRVAIAGLLIGLPANFAYAQIGGLAQEGYRDGLVATAIYAVGVVPLGLAYAALFALAWPRARGVLGVLAAPGRMALTNYLMQSIVCIAIFYGIGLGMAGRLPIQQVWAIAAAIFAGQILLSHLWLRAFAQGPMEWLWRAGTYAGRRRASA